MRSLKLDFLHPQRGPGWVSWLLLAAGFVLVVWSIWHGGRLDRAIAVESAEQLRLNAASRSERAGRISSAPGKPGMLPTGELLALPWNALFARLEKVQSKKIALLALEADGRKTEATLTAEAKTLNDMLAYIEALKREGGFKSVTLSSHTLQEEDEQLPYRFVLRLGWRS